MRADSAVPFANFAHRNDGPAYTCEKLAPEILEESQPRRKNKVQSNFIFKPAPDTNRGIASTHAFSHFRDPEQDIDSFDDAIVLVRDLPRAK